MRIRQIGLKSVLHFDNWGLDFGSAGGLHLLYGPNETGKSTLLQSLLDLLFGGKLDEGMRELYPTNQPHLCGLVEDEEGNSYVLERKKYYSNLVLTEASTVSEERLEGLLGGYDRERYMLLFGFDHARLRLGGDSLLQSGGDAGVTLFEAGGGMQHLQRLQETLSLRTGQLLDANFSPRSAKLLNRAWQAYKKAEEDTRRVGLRGDAWHQLRDEIESLRQRMGELGASGNHLRGQLKRLERVLRVRDVVHRVQGLRHELANLGAVTVLTSQEDGRVITLLSDLEQAMTAIKTEESRLTRLHDAVGAITVAQRVLQHGKDIDGLADRVREVETAQGSEIPKLEQAVSSKETEAAAMLRNLAPNVALTNVESLRVPFVVKDELEQIAAALQRTQQDKQTAQDRAALYADEVSKLEQELDAIGEVTDVAEVLAILSQARAQGNLDEAILRQNRNIRMKQQQLDAILQRQMIWSKTADALTVVPIPLTETIDGFHRRFAELAQVVKQEEARLSEAKAELARLNQELHELEEAGHVPDEAELEAARQHRDETWQTIKTTWILPTEDEDTFTESQVDPQLQAQAYEASVHAADGVSDVLRKEANRVAHRNELMKQIARLVEHIASIQEQARTSRIATDKLQEEWAGQWTKAGIHPLTPEEMRAWRTESYQPVIEGLEQIAQWAQELADTEARCHQWTHELSNALQALGVNLSVPPMNWIAWMGLADRVVTEHRDKQSKRAHKYEQWVEAKRRLSEEGKRVRDVDAELTRLLNRWASLRDANPTLPDEVYVATRYVAQLQQLFQEVTRLSQLRGDLAAKLALCAEFEQDAQATAEQIGEVLEDFASPTRFVRDVAMRLKEAREAATSVRTLRNEIAQVETGLGRHKETMAKLRGEIDDLLAKHACADVAELQELIALSKQYKEVERALEETVAQARMTGDGIQFDVLEEEVMQSGDADVVREAILQLESELQSTEAQIEEVKQSLWEKQQRLAAWDGSQADAAKAAQEAAQHLAQVDVHWNEYLRVELARRLLQRTIDTFRLQNESTVLESASAYFSVLTLERYRGLAVDYEDNVPVVLAHAKDGRMVRVGQLSDGTRDQLFLALRLAFVEQHLRHGNPLPLVMDDILVHFDDDRARATLGVLHELSAKTQIIYFTHQQSVVGTAHHLRDVSRLFYHDLTHVNAMSLESAILSQL